MLRLLDLSLARGPRVLLRGVNLVAPPGERIGLVGANGTGKSTLFAAILGELAPEHGSIEAPPAQRMAHVAQDIDASDTLALDYVLAGHWPLLAAQAELAAAETAGDELRLAQAIAALAELDAAALGAQARALLHGLGFADALLDRPVRSFSGGWRNRLALGRALMRPADLLLLDEPTNHLDLDSVVWLENWLKRQPATVIVISHDREFLDRATRVTWHVDQQTIRRYAGNYSEFELAWAEQQRQQDAAARAYARTTAHLQSFVDRFRAKATKARQAQSRLKMLERLTAVEPVRAQKDWRFEFMPPARLPERLLEGDHLRLGYGAAPPVIDAATFVVRAGDRIGILGVNGAGKSTLARALVGELTPQDGELRRGAGLAIGYFAQHQVDQLRADESPLQHLRRAAPAAREQELRDFLGRFRFAADLAQTPVGPMSGGEKARCALALIAWQRPNCLLLDEPTNHLDMATREALTLALSSFDGALLLVSHDRHLLRAAVDQLWLVHDRRLAPFDGDLDDYADLVLASRREATPARGPEAAADRREQRRREAQARQQASAARRPLQQRAARIEADLASVTAALRELDAQLADADFYHAGEPAAVAAALKQRGELAGRVDALESAWLALQTELDALP